MTVKRTTHFDRSIVLDGSKAVRTRAGYLRVPAAVTRTGVLTYRLPDGTLERRLRHPDDVFDAESLATLAGIPCTEDHPAYRGGPQLLDSDNTKEWQIGYTGDAIEKLDSRRVGASLTITDSASIAAIDSGELYEVSCGYTCEREDTPGVYDGEPYDVRQRNIIYNHVAIVRPGHARGGREMHLHLDSEAAVEVDSANVKEGDNMKLVKMTIGGKEVEVTEDAQAVIQAHLDSVEASKRSAVADAKVAADKAQATIDGLKSDLDKANDKLKATQDAQDPKRIQELVKQSKRIHRVAERVLSKDDVANLDSMTDREIKEAVIKAERPNVSLDGKSDDYVDASFDSIEERLDDNSDTSDRLGQHLSATRKEGTQLDSDSAKQRQNEQFANAWKRDEEKK